MCVNLKRAMFFMKEYFDKIREDLNLKYNIIDGKKAEVFGSVTYKSLKSEIALIAKVYAEGWAYFKLVFDKIDKNLQSLSLVQSLNNEDPFFTAFIRGDGFLELAHVVRVYNEKFLGEYSAEFMKRAILVLKNKNLKKLDELIQ